MNVKVGWLIVLVLVALLAVACGPETAAPTLPAPATEEEVVAESPTETSFVEEIAPTEEQEPAEETEQPSAELPVDEDDWHVLGSPDAPVTIVEYSDFQ